MTTTGGGVTYGRALELKTRDEGWTVEGYVSTYDLDLGNDRVLPGAYRDTLADGHKVRFLYGHDQTKVLGKPLSLREDGTKGLYGTFRISKTELGRDVRQLLLDEAVDSFSVGFIARDWSTDQRTQTRELKAIDLLECSIVSLPMNTAAQVAGVKGRRAPGHPLLRDLEAVIVRLRRKAFIAGLSDAELRGYGQMLRWRVEHRAERLAAGGR